MRSWDDVKESIVPFGGHESCDTNLHSELGNMTLKQWLQTDEILESVEVHTNRKVHFIKLTRSATENSVL